MSLSVTERDAITIRDAVHLLAGYKVRDSRGRIITSPRSYSTNRAFATAGGAMSYGRHFPLFHYVPRDGRHGPLFLVNGDEWRQSGPSRTRDHQRATRDAIDGTCIPSVVIPFTALDGAGIVLNSVRIVDVRPDENWTETRTAEDLKGLPVHARTVHFSVTRTADVLAGVPEHKRSLWRELTPAESEERHGSTYAYAPILPNAAGIYEWTEPRSRELEPNPDTGLFEWDVQVHRLGECLISAVREIVEPLRAADPFESGRDNARERVELTADGSGYCADAENRAHEAGPSGACITCGATLQARSTWKRRARYLSAFDTNELSPLYFLAEVPRTAGATVAAAFDALAPRAVHAALARGLAVQRQGDIFLIPTDVDAPELERRGIRSRARLTMWTRDARARKGESGYSAPLTAADRRELSRIARRNYRAARHALALEPLAPRPYSDSGIRARFAAIRDKNAAEVAAAKERLRRATFRANLYGIRSARQELARLREYGAQDAHGYRSPAHARDRYRSSGTRALDLWHGARVAAHKRLRPELYGARLDARRVNVRRAVSIYGTAHSATEVITLRSGAVYVRGTVQHVPTLEPGRVGPPDHRPVYLGNGERWYLAVRNAVPRQATKRRRRTRRQEVRV